ncbi:MAG TPA: hypothetical protein VFX03_10745 [Thermomicrobiales bacterium]|nr:hypothetical protein [Thermomicrobiales bacterium]
MAEEQTQNDALAAKDDALAVAEREQAATDSQAAHDASNAAATDAVFENLPDTLLAPAEGPAPSVTGEYGGGYRANDFWTG